MLTGREFMRLMGSTGAPKYTSLTAVLRNIDAVGDWSNVRAGAFIAATEGRKTLDTLATGIGVISESPSGQSFRV